MSLNGLKKCAAGAGARARWITMTFCMLCALSPCGEAQNAGNAAMQQRGLLNIAVYPDAISPKEVSVKGRAFLLRVSNHVGVGEIQFELLRESGGKLKQVKLVRGKSKVIEEVVLDPGTYILQVPGRPVWTSRIRVSPASN